MVAPNRLAAMKNTSPKPSAMKYTNMGLGALGSSSSTAGDCESACTRPVGTSRSAITVSPVGESPEGTTAALASPDSTAARAASAESTGIASTSSPRAATSDWEAVVTATVSVEENASERRGRTSEPSRMPPSMMAVVMMNALDARRTRISRPDTTPTACQNGVRRRPRVSRVVAVPLPVFGTCGLFCVLCTVSVLGVITGSSP